VPPDPVQVLRKHFGFPSFRPGQEDLVRAVLAGRDALGVLPTGGGKSVCYQVPACILGGLTLVITPLVSLMEDQVVRARVVGLRAESLSGTQSVSDRRAIRARVAAGSCDLLFVAPERLAMPAFRTLLSEVSVSLLAVDEAHCISEWGHDFRPAYRRIGTLRDGLDCPTLALTASATPPVRADIQESLKLTRPLEVVRSFDRPNLWWAVIPGGSVHTRARSLCRVVGRTRGTGIVYAPTRRSVEGIRDALAAWGVVADAYHAGLTGPERSSVQQRFMEGGSRVVVATNAFGMGIDKADVRFVVHLQLPTSLEAYYQEAGRAGRDGQPSMCLAFDHRSDRALGLRFLERSHPPARTLRRLYGRLRAEADGDGIARVTSKRVQKLLGGRPDGWLAGDPEGPLGALERVGAIRRIPCGNAEECRPKSGSSATRGTGSGQRGSLSDGVEVRRGADLAPARLHRRRSREKLDAVRRFATTKKCRRGALLRYFGEVAPDPCERCDRCEWDFRRGPIHPDG